MKRVLITVESGSLTKYVGKLLKRIHVCPIAEIGKECGAVKVMGSCV